MILVEVWPHDPSLCNISFRAINNVDLAYQAHIDADILKQ